MAPRIELILSTSERTQKIKQISMPNHFIYFFIINIQRHNLKAQ